MKCLHRYKYLWIKCTNRKTIDAAWRKLRKGKTKRKDVRYIEKYYEFFADKIQTLLYMTRPDIDPKFGWQPKKLFPKYIIEHGKEREIYCPPIIDQWVHHIIVQVLAPIIEKVAYTFSCGSMPNKGGIFGKKKIERFLKRGTFKYVAKLDIRHYFKSIHIDILLDELRLFIEDEWFLYLIALCFIQFPKGLPLGFYLSQWVANFLLTIIDWKIYYNKDVKLYIRYVDDFVICGNNKRLLRRLVRYIRIELGKLRLRLKGNWQIFRFQYRDKNGSFRGRMVDFMGFKFGRFRTTLRKHILLKATRMAKRLSKRQQISVRQAQSMISRIGWFAHTSTRKLYYERIVPYVSLSNLKSIISKDSKRRYWNARMDKGTPWEKTRRVRETQ